MSQEVIYRVHALQRMFERGVTAEDVRIVIEYGEIIEAYPDDTPYPSQLILGWVKRRPLHVVAAFNSHDNQIIIITVYEPNPDQWSDDFKRRSSRL
jgi:hypothetical protein